MPRIKFTKSAIDTLPTRTTDVVYWDAGCPGFGLKITPKGRKVFIVLYRTAGAGSALRKYTIGPYGRVTLHQARVAAQKVFSAKLDGRDPAREKREARIREVTDRVEDVLEAFITQHVSKSRSAGEISRLLRREAGTAWKQRSVHDITKRDVVDLVSAIESRGAPMAANKLLKTIKTFFNWCVGRAILEKSPAEGIPLPAPNIARDRILNDVELAKVIRSARIMKYPYGSIVELLALTGQRREEAAGATWDEFDLDRAVWTIPRGRTKNAKSHIVHLPELALAVLRRIPRNGTWVFTINGYKPFSRFSAYKRRLDALSGVSGWRIHDLRRTCVSGMARLGIAPHVADKVLNHQAGTISGVAAVYQRHDFMIERKAAMLCWDEHVRALLIENASGRGMRRVA